jgi:hypothetical protein
LHPISIHATEFNIACIAEILYLHLYMHWLLISNVTFVLQKRWKSQTQNIVRYSSNTIGWNNYCVYRWRSFQVGINRPVINLLQLKVHTIKESYFIHITTTYQTINSTCRLHRAPNSNFLPFFLQSLSIKRNEIFVASRLGVIHRVQWNGTVDKDLSLPVSSIPFSLDLETPIGK